MKLNKLRGAIRTATGNPSIIVELAPGVPLTLVLQKTPLLAELGRAYDGSDDTGLTFNPETGVLSTSGVIDVTTREQAKLDADDLDEDLL